MMFCCSSDSTWASPVVLFSYTLDVNLSSAYYGHEPKAWPDLGPNLNAVRHIELVSDTATEQD